MDGGDIAVAQEHRYVHGGDVAVAPGTSLRPGAAAILGYVRAAKWTGYSTSGGEMDGGDVAVAPGTSLRPGAAVILGYVRAAKWTAAMSP